MSVNLNINHAAVASGTSLLNDALTGATQSLADIFSKGIQQIVSYFTGARNDRPTPVSNPAVPGLLKVLPKGSGQVSDASYIDFGMSFGSNIWGFIKYPPPNYTATLDTTAMGAYLTSLFGQMKGAGQDSIFLAFAQLDNIDAYHTGNFTGKGTDTSYDVIAALLSSMQTNGVAVPGYTEKGKNFLHYLVDQAQANKMQVNLPVGGEVATDTTFKILQQETDTYQAQAGKVFDIMQSYGLASLDWDIEDPSALSSQKPDAAGGTVLDFLKTLHSKLAAVGKTMTLTTMLGSQWRSTFSELLANFPNYFDGLNLMAYSDTQFWLDPNTPAGDPDQGWTIEEWIDAIGKENANSVHVGFDDGVPYITPQANGGQYDYSVQSKSSNSSGQAAAKIYQQLLSQLNKDGYPSNLGDPFFWPDQSVKPHGEDRYAPQKNNTANFVSSDMQDFYNELSGSSPLPKN